MGQLINFFPSQIAEEIAQEQEGVVPLAVTVTTGG